MAQPATGSTQSVDRAVALLRATAEAPEPLTALELADRCSLTRSTAWRLLQALERHGLLERDAARRYAVGHEVVRLASAADPDALLARAARPTLEALVLATRTTANLNVLRAGGVVSIDQVSPSTVLAVDWIGIVAPLHATPSGKAALAGMTAEERAHRLPETLPRLATSTITDRAVLEAEIAVVEERGFATIVDEFEDDLNGIAVAVRGRADRPIAYLTLWGTARRLPPTRFGELGDRLGRAAEDIRRRLA